MCIRDRLYHRLALALCFTLAPSLGLAQSDRAATAEQPADTALTDTSGRPLIAEQACYDVQHYTLWLWVDPANKTIGGELEMRAKMLEASASIALDLDDRYSLGGQKRNGKKVELLSRDKGRLFLPTEGIAAGAEFSITIKYSGMPREAPRPPWKGGFTWAKTKDGSPWIATSRQGEGADVWWPCKDQPGDEPEGFDLHISVPDGLVVASNGSLVGVASTDWGHVSTGDQRPWHTHHWRVSTPISNYSIALNIAPYRTISEPFPSLAGHPFEFTYFVLPENYEKGKAIFAEFREHMAFFEDVCGPYPFRGDKYGVAETPHLGMEHQSIIAYGNGYRGDPNFDYDWLHHHELSHEWWANLVTARDWKDFWIHEGIGTYMQALYLERRFGPEAYAQKLEIDLLRVINHGPVAPRGSRSTQQMYFAKEGSEAPGIDIYMKGAWVCHTLRWVLGDEAFFRVLRRWAYPDPLLEKTTDGSTCRFADTAEMLRIAEEHGGQELDWFFEVYLRRASLPSLMSEVQDGKLLLRWSAPDNLPFPMDVPVLVGDQMRRVPVGPDGARVLLGEQSFQIDPQRRILRVF